MILDKDGFGIWSTIAKKLLNKTYERFNSENDFLQNLGEDFGIYIHIPFCAKICSFCPYIRFTFNESLVKRYLESLKKEIRLYGKALKGAKRNVVDIRIGGGTPSLLSPEDLYEIIKVLNENFDISRNAKFRLEVNPEDLTREKASGFTNVGIDDVSIGVQSFIPHKLVKLGRNHGVKECLKSIENAHKVGFRLINIDMMYMVPGETLNDWISDLKIALEQGADEIDTYPTLIYSNIPAYKKIKEGEIETQPDKATFEQMFYKRDEILKQEGYSSVRRIGFSKSKEKTVVNPAVKQEQLGFGVAAQGSIGNCKRYVNTYSVKEYIRSVFEEKYPIAGMREVDQMECALRELRYNFINERSLNLDQYEKKFGKKIDEIVDKAGIGEVSREISRLLKSFEAIKSHGNNIELTEQGLFIANQLVWAYNTNARSRIHGQFLKTPWPRQVTCGFFL